jgi:transposase
MTDERWAALEPLVEACRPKGKTPPRDLRRTIGGIVWRHENGARWRAVPAEFGPWWRAARLFIRWARLGTWRRLLEAAQAAGVELGMAFLDGTSIRAHAKAAGAPKKGGPAPNGTGRKRSGGRAAGTAPRRASSPTGEVERSHSRSPPAKRTSCR